VYEDIANAAVLEAVEDYKLALIHLKLNPDSERAKRGVRKGERFLFSDEFGRLTTLNPDYLNRKLKEYVNKKYGGHYECI
jgi:hypothetical protein